MKRFFLLSLLIASGASAQQLVNCAPGVPCTTSSGPSNTNTGDAAWLAFGKLNYDVTQLFNQILNIPASATVLGSNSSSQLVAASTTGTAGTAVVLATSPTLVTPNLGTPSTLVLTYATGTPSSINLSNATALPAAALPAFTGAVTSASGSATTSLSSAVVYASNLAPIAAGGTYCNNASSTASPTVCTSLPTAMAIPNGQVSGLAASATTDTTNASNIATGSLSLGLLPVTSKNVVCGTSGNIGQNCLQSSFLFPSSLNMGGTNSASNSILFGSGTNLFGTATQPSNNLISPMNIIISGDSVDTTTSGNGNLIDFNVYGAASAGFTGGRTAIQGYINVVGTSGLVNTVGNVGVAGLARINANQGGTSGAYTNAKGSVFGMNANAFSQSGATYLNSVVSAEFDTAILSGSSADDHFGVTIYEEANHAVRGTYQDVALDFANQESVTNPWLCVICIGNYAHAWPAATDSTLIGAVLRVVPSAGTDVAKYGVDWRNVTFTTGGYAFASNGFTVDPSGNTSVASLTSAGTLTTNVTGSTQCLQANSSGVVSGTGAACGAGGGGGTVNTGTTGQLAYYSSNGTAVSGTGTLPNGTAATTQTSGDNSTKIATDAFVVATAGATNTTGTAANLSGTPTLPNGTAATTQTSGDNSTKIATDAFVVATAGATNTTGNAATATALASTPTQCTGSQFAKGIAASGAANCATAVTSVVAGAGLSGGTITSSGTIATTQGIDSQGGAYTIQASDNTQLVTISNASPVTVGLPAATTAGFGSGFSFLIQNEGAGTITLTPTTSTINGAPSITIIQNTGCYVASDGTNYHTALCTAIYAPAAVNLAASGSGGVTGVLPTANGGTGGNSVPYELASWGVPILLPSSGSFGNNGVLTLTTVLPNTAVCINACYMYFPAGAIASGVPSTGGGVYYAKCTTSTACIVYNNQLTSGVPAIISSPTSFSTTGPGAYTQTTGSYLQLLSITLPAGAMGANGSLQFDLSIGRINNADGVYEQFQFGGQTMATMQLSSYAWSGGFHRVLRNLAGQSNQVVYPSGASATTDQQGNGNTASYLTVNTTTSQPFVINGQLQTTDTDYLVIYGGSILVVPAS